MARWLPRSAVVAQVATDDRRRVVALIVPETSSAAVGVMSALMIVQLVIRELPETWRGASGVMPPMPT